MAAAPPGGFGGGNKPQSNGRCFREAWEGTMLRTRCHTIVLPLALGLLAGALPVGHAAAQTAKDLAGTWTVASVAAEQDGSETQPYGADPKGILMLDDSGRYALVLLRADLPAFASENRTAGTPEENRAVGQGSIAHFGTWYGRQPALRDCRSARRTAGWGAIGIAERRR
jgi:hypothetical protein